MTEKTHAIYTFAKLLGVPDIDVKNLIKEKIIAAAQDTRYGYTASHIPESQLPIAALHLIDRHIARLEKQTAIVSKLRMYEDWEYE